MRLRLILGLCMILLCSFASAAVTDQGLKEAASSVAIIIIPLVAAVLLMWQGVSLNDSHVPMKIFLPMLSLIMLFGAFWFGIVSITGTTTELVETMTEFGWVIGIVLFVLVAYWFVEFIKAAFAVHKQKKEEELQY